MTARGRHEVSFSTTAAANVAATDVSNYCYVCVQINTQGTSSTINFQSSNDNVNWVYCSLVQQTNGGSVPASSSGSTGVIFSGPLLGRYFRLNITGITAGTTAGVAEFFTVAPNPIAGQVMWVNQQSGSWQSALQPQTSNGLTATRLISAATTNATSVKTSAGQIYNVQAFNTNASARFLKLYNLSVAPTVGTSVPVATWVIPGNASGSSLVVEIANGMTFASGIAFAITANMADTDTTAVGASDVAVNLQYK